MKYEEPKKTGGRARPHVGIDMLDEDSLIDLLIIFGYFLLSLVCVWVGLGRHVACFYWLPEPLPYLLLPLRRIWRDSHRCWCRWCCFHACR